MGLFIIKIDAGCIHVFYILCAFFLHYPFLFAKLLGILQKWRKAYFL